MCSTWTVFLYIKIQLTTLVRSVAPISMPEIYKIAVKKFYTTGPMHLHKASNYNGGGAF